MFAFVSAGAGWHNSPDRSWGSTIKNGLELCFCYTKAVSLPNLFEPVIGEVLQHERGWVCRKYELEGLPARPARCHAQGRTMLYQMRKQTTRTQGARKNKT